jgi:hypothetical protein
MLVAREQSFGSSTTNTRSGIAVAARRSRRCILTVAGVRHLELI